MWGAWGAEGNIQIVVEFQVLVLGGGKEDEHVLKRQKRVQMGKQAKAAGHPAHYNHYHTGNGFWVTPLDLSPCR